jgi:DNA (cytosine-5)-methyltransferase 1
VTAGLSCADLFCGAGGFSEGFRQAGFGVTHALDLWPPAVLTHEKNHPETTTIRADIESFEPADIGPVDVLIGSPPCTEFSYANRGGSGDIEEGLRLVYRFLRFVYELQPRWWVMENVPRVLDFLPREVPLRKLGIDKKGVLPIPERRILTSADYGVAQLRKRAFSGAFPVPSPTHIEGKWRTLRDVVTALPDPLGPISGFVTDPLYRFDIPAAELTDHFMPDLILSEEEARENRKAKEDHSWYGRMSFPDELDRPARTVMATNLRVSRETTVIPSSNGGYRRLSVREAASVQGFPITYQWWATSTSLKYKLIGNAVAPPVAFAIACEILAAARLPVLERPHVVTSVTEPAPASSSRERKRSLPATRRFREHVPGSKLPGFRVDLDNRGKAPGHIVGWRAVLYRGSGKALQLEEVDLTQALTMLERTIVGSETRVRARDFLSDLETSLGAAVPDATTLQLIRSERASGDITPYVLIDRVSDLVARHFGQESRLVRMHSPRDPTFVPARIAATLVATAYVSERANGRSPKRVRLPRASRTPKAQEVAAGA